MSLTGHLTKPASPVRVFFETRLPHTRRVVAEVAATQGRPGPALVLPRDSTGYPWSTVGSAFDYRLRFLLAPTPVGQLLAYRGAQNLAGRSGALPAAFTGLGPLIDALLSGAGRALLSGERERELARACFVLALYEQCYRIGPNPSWPIVALGRDADVRAVLALCDERAALDIPALIRLFLQTQPFLLSSDDVTPNPTFAGSASLGGADADLIVDRTLIDLKTVTRGWFGRAELWQLVGYVLADLDDTYGIERVGVYLARHGRLIDWDLPVLLERLAGSPVSLPALRADFAEHPGRPRRAQGCRSPGASGAAGRGAGYTSCPHRVCRGRTQQSTGRPRPIAEGRWGHRASVQTGVARADQSRPPTSCSIRPAASGRASVRVHALTPGAAPHWVSG